MLGVYTFFYGCARSQLEANNLNTASFAILFALQCHAETGVSYNVTIIPKHKWRTHRDDISGRSLPNKHTFWEAHLWRVVGNIIAHLAAAPVQLMASCARRCCAGWPVRPIGARFLNNYVINIYLNSSHRVARFDVRVWVLKRCRHAVDI